MFGSRRRAHREATALSTLEHPNIVRCFGVHEPVYVLMEYLQGRTLGEVIHQRPRGRLSVSDSIRVAIHLGAALEHIHGKGFLHLDVKPDNVVIVHGRPVLFDFGSLRVRTEERPQQIHGTDAYIAPEEWLLQETGPSADVFSLGVTLYEMLTGKLPFHTNRQARRAPGDAPARTAEEAPASGQRGDWRTLSCSALPATRRPARRSGHCYPRFTAKSAAGRPCGPNRCQVAGFGRAKVGLATMG